MYLVTIVTLYMCLPYLDEFAFKTFSFYYITFECQYPALQLQSGPRLLTSRDLNTTLADFVQFYIQLGGHQDVQCTGIEKRSEGVLLQASTDGGITWRTLKELQGSDYRTPGY